MWPAGQSRAGVSWDSCGPRAKKLVKMDQNLVITVMNDDEIRQ